MLSKCYFRWLLFRGYSRLESAVARSAAYFAGNSFTLSSVIAMICSKVGAVLQNIQHSVGICLEQLDECSLE